MLKNLSGLVPEAVTNVLTTTDSASPKLRFHFGLITILNATGSTIDDGFGLIKNESK